MIQPFEKYGLTFKTVEEDDAAFIVGLRTDPVLSRYISATEADVNKQTEWIKAYKRREEQGEEIYFISLNAKGERQGLNRLYNYDAECFEIGSWLYKSGLEVSVPVLGDLAARDYGFETLGFNCCKFSVRKDNLSVLKYHNGFNAQRTGESQLDYYFKLCYYNYTTCRDKLLKLLHHG